jgi:hypothetical protein
MDELRKASLQQQKQAELPLAAASKDKEAGNGEEKAAAARGDAQLELVGCFKIAVLKQRQHCGSTA